jgi:nucleotide-binding universal stress UspA family protein
MAQPACEGALGIRDNEEEEMDTTVVGVDDSRGARAALAWAAQHAAATGGRLRVIHAYEFPIAWIDDRAPELLKWTQRARREAEEAAERVVSDVLEPGQREGVEVEVVEGSPADVLHDQSREAAVVVVGSRGRGGFAGLLLGSVSQRVAQHAVCPVVIVPNPPEASPAST